MTGSMSLRIVTPTETVVDARAARIVAEAPNGSFGLLPRHVDFVSALVPGVLVFEEEGGRERFVGLDQGTLVKRGREVLVSTRDALSGDDLGTLEARVARSFLEIDEHERVARSALARLEAGMVRRFLDLEREPT